MKLALLISLIFISPQISAQTQILCPSTLASSFETPNGWLLKKDTLELTFIGSTFKASEFTCYYGVGRVALSKALNKQGCKLKMSHTNPIGVTMGNVCNGMAEDCALICP